MIKTRIQLTLSLLLMLAAGSILAEIYRSVDEEGNVIFTDQPDANARKVEIEPTNILKPLESKAVVPNKEVEPKEAFKYQLLEITTPEDGISLRNISQLSIAAQLIPNLHKQHKIRFLDNGAPLREPSRSLAMTIQDPDRGTHQFQAQVIDEKGNTLISSASVSVHVHKTSILHPRPQ